ncbi:hypothetical protein AB0J55_29300 [Amycolatopsis sp. NPDC049688]|uniref:hypothetical protein n=1 Tax=Amycolatopsis sp. NPDC049688 TaxID=3154733 RepID=UPI0034477205
MKEFENALAAAFGARPAEVPGLAIDQLDGRAPGSGAAPLCYTWAAEPVRGSVSPCLDGEPVRACGTCQAEHADPVRPSVCRVEQADPVRPTVCRVEHVDPVRPTVCRVEAVPASYCAAEPVPASYCQAEPQQVQVCFCQAEVPEPVAATAG